MVHSNRKTRGTVRNSTSASKMPDGVTKLDTPVGNDVSRSLAIIGNSTNGILKIIDKKDTKKLSTPYSDKEKTLFQKTQKEYEEAVESLKDKAHKTFGDNYSKSKDYRKEMLALQRSYKKEMDESLKFTTQYTDKDKTAMEVLVDDYKESVESLNDKAQKTFGDKFGDNTEYQKQRKALEQQYGARIKKQQEEDSLRHQFFTTITKKVDDIPKKTQTSLRGAILGPLNLLVAPFEDFFGGTVGEGMKALFGKGKELFSKFTNKKPNASDVLKRGGQAGIGALFIANTIKDVFGDKKDDNKGVKGIIGKILDGLKAIGKFIASIASFLSPKKLLSKITGAFTKLGGGNLLKGLSIGGIITAILMAVIDGIKGIFKAKEWKVSKLSAFVGAFFSGTGSGIKGAFANMGKWALLGVSIGLPIAPPIGAIVGGILGAAIGGILGFFGGQKTAQALTSLWKTISKYFKNVVFPAMKDFIFELIGIDRLKKFVAIWKGDGSIAKKLGKTMANLMLWVISAPMRYFSSTSKLMYKALSAINWKAIFSKAKDLPKILGNIIVAIAGAIKDFFSWKNIKSMFTTVGGAVGDYASGFSEIILSVWDAIKGFFSYENIKKKADEAWKKLKEFDTILKTFVQNTFTTIGDKLTEFFKTNPITKFLDEHIVQPIKDFLSIIGDTFGFIKEMGVLGSIKTLATGKWEENFAEYQAKKAEEEAKTKKVDDAIIKRDGTIIHTSPDDNIIATKNLPVNMDTVHINAKKDLNSTLSTISPSGSIDDKMDKLIHLLQQILTKNPVNISLPTQTRADLDMIMSGGIV